MTSTVTAKRRLERLRSTAAAAHARRDLAGAERAYRQMLSFDPNDAMALHELGMLSLAMGRPDEAEACLERAVAAAPGDVAARSNLANLLQQRGELDRAAAEYEAVLASEPTHQNARYNLATVLTRRGQPRLALAHYRALLERAPADLEARKALAASLLDAGEAREAEQSLRDTVAMSPRDAEALNLLGVALARCGDTEQAQRCYLAAIEARPDYARPYENLVRTRRFDTPDGALVERLERIAGSGALAAESRVSALFALGKIYDDCAEYAKAFARYREGNRLVRARVAFDRDAHRAVVDAIIAACDGSFVSAGGGIETPLPVYVLGMIRSGTSLVEQILASHPQVHGAGEQAIVPQAAARLCAGAGYPAGLSSVDERATTEAARACLASLRSLGGDAARVVDKLPGNFLYLGLVSRMFPDASIVHCLRDPLDVCLSIYFQRFADGHHYAYDLGDIASYYRDYERLVQHWRRVLPRPVHEVRYEALVADGEAVSRALVSACGMPWDARCLQYHLTERVVSTASDWQVRQPLYDRSVARWRHYAGHIGELRAALEA